MMGYVDQNLMTNEKVILYAYLHWVIYTKAISFLVLGASLFVWANLNPDTAQLSILGVLLGFVGCVELVSKIVLSKTSEFAVTDKRVIIKVGFISRKTLEMNLSKIENVGVDQGIIARMLGFGSIRVVGTGGTSEMFYDIKDPMNFRRTVQVHSQ